MRYFEDEISGIDGSTATFVGYCLDNSSEIDPNRKRPSVLVIPGGGYEMTSDREAEPIAMQFLAAGFNAFVLRYSVKPSIFPVALLEAAEAMRRGFVRMPTNGIAMPTRSRRSASPPAVTLPPILRLPPATTCSRHMVTTRMRCARTA